MHVCMCLVWVLMELLSELLQLKFTSVNHLAIPSNKLLLPDCSSLCAWNEA